MTILIVGGERGADVVRSDTRFHESYKAVAAGIYGSVFEDKQNHEILNRLTQLLGRQRKQEDFLRSERTYAPRVEGVPTVMVEALEREQDKGRRK